MLIFDVGSRQSWRELLEGQHSLWSLWRYFSCHCILVGYVCPSSIMHYSHRTIPQRITPECNSNIDSLYFDRYAYRNKADLPETAREVPMSEALELARAKGIPYIETRWAPC